MMGLKFRRRPKVRTYYITFTYFNKNVETIGWVIKGTLNNMSTDAGLYAEILDISEQKGSDIVIHNWRELSRAGLTTQ